MTTAQETNTTCHTDTFDLLCDETLAQVVTFLDLASSVIFSKCTAKTLNHRFFSVPDNFGHVWRGIYHRHNFTPPLLDSTRERSCPVDYLDQCRYKLSLCRNLFNERSRSKIYGGTVIGSTCFSLPDRYFCFFPIVPRIRADDDDDDVADDDASMESNPYPVNFPCTSFLLTSPSTSSEMVFLDPFDGEISVIPDILSYTHSNINERPWKMSMGINRTAGVPRIPVVNYPDSYLCDNRELLATETGTKKDDREILFSVNDYFQINLRNYVTSDSRQNIKDDTEVIIDWLGIDVRSIVEPSTRLLKGAMVAAARVLSTEITARATDDLWSCTELLVWLRNSTVGKFEEKWNCRIDGLPYYMDICPQHLKVYAVFLVGEGPPNLEGFQQGTQLDRQRIADNQNDLDDDNMMTRRSATIVSYPLVPCSNLAVDDETPRDEAISYGRNNRLSSFFPEAKLEIVCKNPVVCFLVDATGTNIVTGEEGGIIEVWNLEADVPTRIQIIDICVTLTKRERTPSLEAQVETSLLPFSQAEIQSISVTEKCWVGPDPVDETSGILEGEQRRKILDDESVRSSTSTLAIQEDDHDSALLLTHCNPCSGVSDIVLPKHLSVEIAGFVALQYQQSEGSTLSLWAVSKNKRFNLQSLINLPLAPQRKPQVHYDGRRLIVFGQDHIGLIILVYHVMSSWEDHPSFAKRSLRRSSTKVPGGNIFEDSGGVINIFPSQPYVQYVNRIRHGCLGGLEYYDEIFMTANERYIILNTKTGNLIAEYSLKNTSEGLVVIDLEEHM